MGYYFLSLGDLLGYDFGFVGGFLFGRLTFIMTLVSPLGVRFLFLSSFLPFCGDDGSGAGAVLSVQ